MYHVTSVVLNYKSGADLKLLIPQLLMQRGIVHTIVIVDNDSGSESVSQITNWLATFPLDTTVGSQEEVNAWVENNREVLCVRNRIYFVDNRYNGGYSAGNNIGIRLAESLGSEAVLIVNPDVRIIDDNYIVSLASVLFSEDRNCIAASRVLGLDKMDQSPLQEPSFWQELLWPRFFFKKFIKRRGYIIEVNGVSPLAVPKVSGCCLLLKMSFLSSTHYLDEGVFLYCEEPILAARVRQVGGLTVFIPTLSVIHAHVASRKSDSSARMIDFIKSRRYYLRQFSKYNKIQMFSLNTSYAVLRFLHATKLRVKRMRIK